MSNDLDLEALAKSDPDAFAEAKRLLAAVNEQQWPRVLKLGTPIQFGKQTVITELTFQKGTYGVLKGLRIDRAPDVNELMLIASRLCGQPVNVIELLDPDDADEVTTIALGFFGRCRGAGKRLSSI